MNIYTQTVYSLLNIADSLSLEKKSITHDWLKRHCKCTVVPITLNIMFQDAKITKRFFVLDLLSTNKHNTQTCPLTSTYTPRTVWSNNPIGALKPQEKWKENGVYVQTMTTDE